MVEPGGRWKFERAHPREAKPLDHPQPLFMPGEELLYVKAHYRNREANVQSCLQAAYELT